MTQLIDIRQAVVAAMEFANMLYGGKLPPDFLLEEVELDPEEKYWLVTFGFALPERQSNVSTLLGQQSKTPRTYKLIKVDAKTGIPKSMKIRSP
jgi:hypothetical protein